jgi:hypothetical protein
MNKSSVSCRTKQNCGLHLRKTMDQTSIGRKPTRKHKSFAVQMASQYREVAEGKALGTRGPTFTSRQEPLGRSLERLFTMLRVESRR